VLVALRPTGLLSTAVCKPGVAGKHVGTCTEGSTLGKATTGCGCETRADDAAADGLFTNIVAACRKTRDGRKYQYDFGQSHDCIPFPRLYTGATRSL
jgi:hypothetical protein